MGIRIKVGLSGVLAYSQHHFYSQHLMCVLCEGQGQTATVTSTRRKREGSLGNGDDQDSGAHVL